MSEDARSMILRRKPLNDELWSTHRGKELVGLIALIKRIRTYWETATSSPYFAVVPIDDQGLYATFLSDLNFLLNIASIDVSTKQQIRTLVPPEFIDSSLALAMDDEIKGAISDAFNRAISTLRREAITQNVFTLEDDPTGMFSIFDVELNEIRKNNLQLLEKEEIRYGLREPLSEMTLLSQSLESLERSLRIHVATTLNDQWEAVPKDLRIKAEKRAQQESLRNPRISIDTMTDKLSFCDMRDLENIMIEGKNWPLFESHFGSKLELRTRFSMVAPFRNAKAHVRMPDDAAAADLKAAITWFKIHLPED